MNTNRNVPLRGIADSTKRESAPPAKIGSATASYDRAGDLTGDGTDTYQYDAEGHLTSVNSGSTATFQYNALGWRVYWPNNGNLSYWHDLEGNTLGGSWGSNWNAFLWVGGREVADYESDGAHFGHANVLNSTTQTTDWSGSNSQEVLLYPFGEIWYQTPGYFVHTVFAGQQGYDPSLDTYQTPFRRFQPLLGRWMTPDPLSGDITNPQSLNRYAYVLNNPASLTDPLGLQSDGPDSCSDPYYADTHAYCQGPAQGCSWVGDVNCCAGNDIGGDNAELCDPMIGDLPPPIQWNPLPSINQPTAAGQSGALGGGSSFNPAVPIEELGACVLAPELCTALTVITVVSVAYESYELWKHRPPATAQPQATPASPAEPQANERPPRTGKVCYDLYLAEAADCKEKHNPNSEEYDACMDLADLNYTRCTQGLPPTPSK